MSALESKPAAEKSKAESAAEDRITEFRSEIADLQRSMNECKQRIFSLAGRVKLANSAIDKDMLKDSMREEARSFARHKAALDRKRAALSQLQNMFTRWKELDDMKGIGAFFDAFVKHAPTVDSRKITNNLKNATHAMDEWNEAHEEVVGALEDGKNQDIVSGYGGARDDESVDELLEAILSGKDTTEPSFLPALDNVKLPASAQFSIMGDGEHYVFDDEYNEPSEMELDTTKFLQGNQAKFVYC
jgi:hypothetical protein